MSQLVSRQKMMLFLPAVMVVGMACAEDLTIVSAPQGQVEALFVPLGDFVIVPKPNDIARVDGKVQKPVADAILYPAQASYDRYLNTLDGWPTGVVFADSKFSGRLDPSSINQSNMVVYNVTDLANPVKVEGLHLQYVEKDFQDGARSQVRAWAPPDGWQKGNRYVGFVLTGPDGIKDIDGNPVIRTAFFDMATGSNPLCEWDENRTWDAESGTCAVPADGGEGKGCCTHNYSALLESAIKKLVRSSAQSRPLEEVEHEVHRTILSAATTFERVRREYDELLGVADALGFGRENVATLWPFTMLTMTESIFDPTAVPPVIPTPTDLVRDPATGMLNVSNYPTSTPADIEFTAFLNSLDGWPADITVDISFSGDVDETSLEQALLLYEIGGTPQEPTLSRVTGFTVTYNAEAREVSLAMPGGFKRGAEYAALLVGGETGVKNKDTSLSTTPRRQSLMHLVLISDPPCIYDEAGQVCSQIRIDGPCHDDYPGKPGGMDGITKCTIIEQLRRKFDGLLQRIVPMEGINREDVLSMQTFTITSQTEMLMDPLNGILPLPNDMLLDRQTGLVEMPENPMIPEALRLQLNELDGFTTQGPTYTAISGKVDPDTLEVLQGFLAVDVTGGGVPVGFDFTVDEQAGAIVARPSEPLLENNQYAIALISKREEGEMMADGGLTDDKGRRVIPSKFFALIRSASPLYDEATGKSLISVANDTTAELLEMVRLGFKELFDKAEDMLGVQRKDIVSAWAFTTQTITKPLVDLRQEALDELNTRDSGQPTFSGTVNTTLANFPSMIWENPVSHANLGAWVPNGTYKALWLIDEDDTARLVSDVTAGELRDVPFILTLPQGTMPSNGWPLVVYCHGVTGSKEFGLFLVDEFAQAGYATLLADLPYHGARTWCTENEHCADSGTCNKQTGTCSTSLAVQSDGVTFLASGTRFLNTENPFALRDNIGQHVVEVSALLRAIEKGAASGITGATVKFDTSNVQYVARSIGGILGTVAMSLEHLPKRIALIAPGAPLADIFPEGAFWDEWVDNILEAFGIERGTVGYLQLLQMFHWILDPTDAGNWARYIKRQQLESPKLPPKEVLIQLAGADTIVVTARGKYLAGLIGADITNTVFPGVNHRFVLFPHPEGTQNVTKAAQAQLIHWLNTGTICTPDVAAGTCN